MEWKIYHAMAVKASHLLLPVPCRWASYSWPIFERNWCTYTDRKVFLDNFDLIDGMFNLNGMEDGTNDEDELTHAMPPNGQFSI